MKRQPRKLRWTKTHRALRGKEMTVDTDLLLSQFAKRRNVPVKYDRNLVAATLRAMERVEEIRRRRERAFARKRLGGKLARERRRMQDRKTVAEGIHLLGKEMRERERGGEAVVEKEVSRVHGTEKLRQKAKRRLRVDGGVDEEMVLD